MLKNKFIIVKIKELFFPVTICCFMLFLLVFSSSNILAAKAGILLWYNAVLPSLLPFFIATNLLSHTNFVSYLGKYFSKIMRPVFNVPGEGAFPLIMGIISGYPVGAKIVSDFKEERYCFRSRSRKTSGFYKQFWTAVYFRYRSEYLFFKIKQLALSCLLLIF